MNNFKIGEKVIVATRIEVWRSDATESKSTLIINAGEEVTITNIRTGGNIEIDKVDPKYGCFLPSYFKRKKK